MASSIAATAHHRARWPWLPRTLRISLGARAGWNATFALYLLLQREHAVGPLITAFVRYAYLDGVLALVVAAAYLAADPQRMLWMSPAIDALTRGALVAIVAVGPGVLDVPLTAMLYLGLLATFAVVDGGLDLLEGFSLEHDRDYGSRWLPLSVSGSVAMAAGVVMFVADPAVAPLRVILVVLSFAHAAAAVFELPSRARS